MQPGQVTIRVTEVGRPRFPKNTEQCYVPLHYDKVVDGDPDLVERLRQHRVVVVWECQQLLSNRLYTIELRDFGTTKRWVYVSGG